MIINRYKKLILVGVALIVIIVAGYLAYLNYSRLGKIAVSVYAVPTDMRIEIAEGQVIEPGTTYLEPGAYRVKATREGFESYQGNLIVAEDNNPTLDLALLPESEEAKRFVQENQQLYLENEARGGELARQQGQVFEERNPITKLLPFHDPYYSIGYLSSDNTTIKITISTPSPLYRYYATEKIRELGYDPTDFEIIYKDFKNPLE